MDSFFSPEIRRNPYPMYKMMRETQPVLYFKPYNIWSVFRYDDVKSVLSDHTRFSSQYVDKNLLQASASMQTRMNSSLITSDPPRHTKLRSLVSRVFTPRAIEALEPRIHDITNELLDRIADKEDFDLVQDLSYPLPVIVIAEMLGIPSEDREQFKYWSDEVVASADQAIGGKDADSTKAHQEMNEYFRKIIMKRREDPQDDLISALIQAEEDHQHLSEDDVLSFCWLLLVAGNETTTNLISNTVLTLLEQPNEFERLRNNMELLPAAIEETLRYRSPVQAMFRFAKQDIEMSGTTIPEGSRIIAWIGSANRDPDKFAIPEQFDMNRNPNPHIAFGHGIHFCLGAPLARMEAKIALSLLLSRISQFERINDEPLEMARGFIVHGVKNLPLKIAGRQE